MRRRDCVCEKGMGCREGGRVWGGREREREREREKEKEEEQGGCFEKDDVAVLQRNATQRDEAIGLRKITAKV